MWHPSSTAPFDRDLELAIIDSNGVRAIAYPCRRVLGGWIKAEIKTRVELCPTHWRDWSTVANVKREHKMPAFMAKNPAVAVLLLELDDGTSIPEPEN
jgi:hypothetical protein